MSLRPLLSAALLVGALLLLACGQEDPARATASDQPVYGGILKRAHPTDPAGFDPIQDTSITTLFLIAPIYSQLIRFDPEAGFDRLIPELAESWDLSGDGKRLTFTLRSGVSWHDGEPFTSADVKSHFDRLISPPKGLFSAQRAPFLHVTSIEAPDPATVAFNTAFATAPFVASFAGGHFMVVSKHVMERETRDDPRGLRKRPEALVGTGPFAFAEYEPGVAFRVRKSDGYWDEGKPYLDGIDYIIIRDAATRAGALAAGQVHMSAQGSPSLSPAQAQQIQQDQGDEILLERVRGPFWMGAAFNATRPPFDDARVRRALSLAVDRQAYRATVSGGDRYGVGVVGGISPPHTTFALSQEELLALPGYRQPKAGDLEEARRLLAEAGHGAGLDTSIVVRGDVPLWVDSAVFFQEQWAKIGVNARVETVEFAGSIQRMLRGDFDIRIGGIAFNLSDPNQVLFAPFSSGGPNFLYYPKDAEVDRLLDAQRGELDPVRRRRLSQEAERRLLQEVVPAVVGHYSIYNYGTRRVVGGWKAYDYMLYNQHRMDGVWLRP
jgi:peptide/nickel transport system substrate-binding protein